MVLIGKEEFEDDVLFGMREIIKQSHPPIMIKYKSIEIFSDTDI